MPTTTNPYFLTVLFPMGANFFQSNTHTHTQVNIHTHKNLSIKKISWIKKIGRLRKHEACIEKPIALSHWKLAFDISLPSLLPVLTHILLWMYFLPWAVSWFCYCSCLCSVFLFLDRRTWKYQLIPSRFQHPHCSKPSAALGLFHVLFLTHSAIFQR